MNGCCNNAMGVIYVNQQGTVDPNFIKKNYPEGSKLVAIQDSTSGWAKSRFKQTGEFPTTIKVVDPIGEIHDICWCNCHTEGSHYFC